MFSLQLMRRDHTYKPAMTSVLIVICFWVAIAALLTALWVLYVEVHLAKLNRGDRPAVAKTNDVRIAHATRSGGVAEGAPTVPSRRERALTLVSSLDDAEPADRQQLAAKRLPTRDTATAVASARPQRQAKAT